MFDILCATCATWRNHRRALAVTIAVFLGYSLAIAFAAYGWGHPFVKSHRCAEHVGPVFTTCTGFAVFVPACGLVMLFGIPGYLVVWLMLAVGWCVGIRALATTMRRTPHPHARRRLRRFLVTSPHALPATLAIVIAVATIAFLAMTLVPSFGFNHVDDYRYYLLRPVRFLVEGTLFRDLYDPILMDSLGGQALFQSLFVAVLPLTYIKAFDGVFCFALSLGLLVEYAYRTRCTGWTLCFAVCLMIVIHPQTVNESALYSGVMLLFTLLYLLQVTQTQSVHNPSGHGPTHDWLIAIVLVALIATKNSFVFFVAPMLFLFVIGRRMTVANSRTPFGQLSRVAVLSGIVSMPFLLLTTDRIEAVLTHPGYAAEAVPLAVQVETFVANIEGLFRFWPLLYGGTTHMYVSLVLLGAITAAVVLSIRLVRPASSSGHLMVVPCAALLALTVGYLAVGGVMGPEHGIRYSAPVFVAVLPFAFQVLSNAPALRSYVDKRQALVGNVGKTMLIVSFAFVPLMFSELLPFRIARAAVFNTQISYEYSAGLHAYGKASLDESEQEQLRALQHLVPAGAPMLVFVQRPFQLDFRRNLINVVSEWGLVTPWNPIPFYASGERLLRQLQANGTRYVLWEYRLPAANTDSIYQFHAHSDRAMFRKFGMRNLSLTALLDEVTLHSETVFDDGTIKLLKLGAP